MLARPPTGGVLTRIRNRVANTLLAAAEWSSGGPNGPLGPFGVYAGSDGMESGRAGHRLRNWFPSRVHINTLMFTSGRTTLARSRYLARNNGYAISATECFASNLIGAGIIPAWQLEADAKSAVHEKWADWCEVADSENVSDFYGFQRRVARELFIAGEVFIRRRPRYLSDGLPVPLQLQIVPSEQLPIERNIWLDNGRRVRQGVEFDRIGRRIAYHFWKVHPGDLTQSENLGQIVRVPATEILHIHDPLEAGQIRGWPKLTQNIVSLWTLDAYDDAEMERKKTAALFSLFVHRPDNDGTMFESETERLRDANVERSEITLEPGIAQVLMPGEQIQVAEPADVGPNYDMFQYRTLTRICAAMGLPYPGVTGDTSKSNYSSTRVAMLEMQRRMEALQYGVMVHQLCRPVAAWFLQAAMLADALPLMPQDETPELPPEYTRMTWIPPKWDWVDPLKDIQAEALAVSNGFKSRSQVIRRMGDDPEEVDTLTAEDQARQDTLGLVFPATVPKTDPAAVPAKEDA